MCRGPRMDNRKKEQKEARKQAAQDRRFRRALRNEVKRREHG